jgi:hypothetical protein
MNQVDPFLAMKNGRGIPLRRMSRNMMNTIVAVTVGTKENLNARTKL